MKESIVAVIIIVVVIIMCIYTTVFTSHFCEDLKENVIACMDAAEQSDWVSATKYINNTKSIFEEKNSKLETFIMHQDLSEVRDSLLKIDASIKLKNLDICISEANYLLGQLDRMSSSDSLTIANIL